VYFMNAYMRIQSMREWVHCVMLMYVCVSMYLFISPSTYLEEFKMGTFCGEKGRLVVG
jgi:hypothetical protein